MEIWKVRQASISFQFDAGFFSFFDKKYSRQKCKISEFKLLDFESNYKMVTIDIENVIDIENLVTAIQEH